MTKVVYELSKTTHWKNFFLAKINPQNNGLFPFHGLNQLRKIVVANYRNRDANYTVIKVKCPHGCLNGEMVSVDNSGYDCPIPCPHCN